MKRAGQKDTQAKREIDKRARQKSTQIKRVIDTVINDGKRENWVNDKPDVKIEEKYKKNMKRVGQNR